MPAFTINGGPKTVMIISADGQSAGEYCLSLSDVAQQRKFGPAINIPANMSGKIVGTLVLNDGNYDFSQNTRWDANDTSKVGFFKSDGSYVAAGSVVIQNDAT